MKEQVGAGSKEKQFRKSFLRNLRGINSEKVVDLLLEWGKVKIEANKIVSLEIRNTILQGVFAFIELDERKGYGYFVAGINFVGPDNSTNSVMTFQADLSNYKESWISSTKKEGVSRVALLFSDNCAVLIENSGNIKTLLLKD
ncbi:hypothetical protein A2125_00230 [Candidatus Woesebacteria bacterium GWB1_43_5]|uniref:Uncharacterized protein n=1 Tax=Candidatus Woesebacteria bacterium GWB1_43_5 TaxID=1802474 RepID=A0A1F7WSE3_9BACT|nr:MAG: hypothetical protein A2125_00230 [Candidatus Woesebacteria bacterium GWB1_43_5]